MTPLQQAAFLRGLLATAAAPHRRRGTPPNTAEGERRSPTHTHRRSELVIKAAECAQNRRGLRLSSSQKCMGCMPAKETAAKTGRPDLMRIVHALAGACTPWDGLPVTRIEHASLRPSVCVRQCVEGAGTLAPTAGAPTVAARQSHRVAAMPCRHTPPPLSRVQLETRASRVYCTRLAGDRLNRVPTAGNSSMRVTGQGQSQHMCVRLQHDAGTTGRQPLQVKQACCMLQHLTTTAMAAGPAVQHTSGEGISRDKLVTHCARPQQRTRQAPPRRCGRNLCGQSSTTDSCATCEQ